MSILVRHAMTEAPQTIGADMNAADAAAMMRTEDVGVLPVVEGGRLLGLVTDRDLVTARGGGAKGPEGGEGGRCHDRLAGHRHSRHEAL